MILMFFCADYVFGTYLIWSYSLRLGLPVESKAIKVGIAGDFMVATVSVPENLRRQ